MVMYVCLALSITALFKGRKSVIAVVSERLQWVDFSRSRMAETGQKQQFKTPSRGHSALC
jgi:hypothetical protein